MSSIFRIISARSRISTTPSSAFRRDIQTYWQRRQWSQRRTYASFDDRARNKAAVGVFSPLAAALFVATGTGLFFYFRHEKEKLLEARQKELESKQYGRPKVGGPFTLTTHLNQPFSEKDLLGKWNFLYFGFTNCPDICPAELDKIGTITDDLVKQYGDIFQPVFITVDPIRDPPSQIARYLSDFRKGFVGLTGEYSAIKAVCKAFRVYFSTPPNADPNGDYLVDHSIFIYLMDPDGNFVEAFGQVSTVEDVVERVKKEIGEWEQEHGSRT